MGVFVFICSSRQRRTGLIPVGHENAVTDFMSN